MDTIVFGLILAAALIIVFNEKRWIIVTSWVVATVAAFVLFIHHVTTALPLNF